ncbi:MAG: PAS domain-containing protein [Pedobacter sp.]|uniref:PAS domain-containing sensor histidine kinase n=1 Tax=Pedobacter sp. TaxID=1411316 RepID=UPI0028092BCB|nr:PAS domain-containing protein [Pedobacter sp.]MDQ8003537.1 PAS domain-containing protein [Pedobacter sp.]
MSNPLDTSLILNAIPLACYMLDRDANFSYVNDKALHFFKMKREEMLGKNVWAMFPESVKTNYYKEINDAIVHQKEITFEYISVFSKSWIKLSVMPLLDGVVISFSCIERDKHNENLYKTLVENTPDIITKWTRDLELSYGNSAFEAAAGISLADALGKTHQEIWPNTDFNALINKAKTVINDGNSQTVVIPITTTDREIFYDIKLSPELTVGGKVESVIEISRDITSLKISQDAFSTELRNKYKSLFNSINQGFCIIDVIFDDHGTGIDYRFIEANPAFEKQTGISNYEGRTMKEISPNHEKHWYEIYGDIVKNQKSAHFELPALALINGWYEVEAFPISVLGDNVVGILFNDITERKRVQEVLIQNELKDFEKKQQKEILKASLNAQEEERQRIAEMLHNGLGQVLYGVKANLERLKLEDENAYEENLKVLERSKELLGMCIKESRRISHELMPSILEDFGLKAGVNDICAQLKGKTRFKCTFSGLDAPLDKYLQLAIYRIIQELALNIMKHSEAHHASINITVEDNQVNVTVKDNGKGFDVSERRDKGIGLKTIESKVKLLNGKMTITSVPQQTTVHIQFPL